MVTEEHEGGVIRITLVESDRMEAITSLARALEKTAAALSAAPSVEINRAVLADIEGIGISITAPQVSHTAIRNTSITGAGTGVRVATDPVAGAGPIAFPCSRCGAGVGVRCARLKAGVFHKARTALAR